MLKRSNTALKVLKFAHLLAACFWIGGAVSLAALNLFNPYANSSGMLYGINASGHRIDLWVVIPGACGCLITGLLYSWFTPWGFFKHRWIILKWLITVGGILSGTFLLGQWEELMGGMSKEIGIAALAYAPFLEVKARHLSVGMIQLAILGVAVFLSVFRPWKNSGKPE